MIRSLVVLTFLLLTPAAQAEEPAPAWGGHVTLYGWLSAAEMDTTVSLPNGTSVTAAQSVGIADILDALDFAAFANAEIRYGRFALIGDLMYTKLSADETNASGVRLDTDLKQVIALTAVGWRAWENEAAFVDLLGGVRIISMDIGVSRRGIVLTQAASASQTLVDPVFGLRAGYRATDDIAFTVSGDVGGFGVGTELSWEVFAGMRYAVTDSITSDVGFRYLSLKIDEGPINTRIQLYGPVLGASYHF